MKMIKHIFDKYKEFIKFCLVGVMNTVISLIIYTVLIKLGLHYIMASCIGYIVGIANGFILSSRFVFEEKLSGNKGIKFIFIYLTALVINLLIISVLIEWCGINEIIAQVIATTFNVIYNYLLNKIWTFKKNRTH